MNFLEQNLKLNYPTKVEQVDASVRFALEEQPAYYASLGCLPIRVPAALLAMVAESESPAGYHFRVLRLAYLQFSKGSGFIAGDEPPFTEV
jgi:hypothetical protein